MSAPLNNVSGSRGLPGSQAMSNLARDLHKLGREGRKELKSTFRAIGGPLLSDARRRAGFSTRIPAAISIRPIADESRVRYGVELRVDTAAAPHARPYEGISQQGSDRYWRHPVFGNEDVWVSQRSRPYAVPAVVAQGERARRAMAAAVDIACRAAGFR